MYGRNDWMVALFICLFVFCLIFQYIYKKYIYNIYIYIYIYIYILASTTENDTTGKSYSRLTEGTFKQRYMQHKLSFQNRNYSNSRELSKHIWTLKDNNTNFIINWSILATAPAYSNKNKRCHLCLTEKLYLVRAKKPSLLNKRTELISKCCHENKFYSANFTSRQQ